MFWKLGSNPVHNECESAKGFGLYFFVPQGAYALQYCVVETTSHLFGLSVQHRI